MSNIDWKKETRQNPIYPNGTYKVKLDSYERVTASTGTRQIRWRAEIVEPKEHTGRTIIEHTALTEKALWKVANLVYGFGIDTMKLGNMSTESSAFDEVCRACKGRTAYWRNEQGTDLKGNPKNEIVEFRRDEEQPEIAQITADAPDWAQ